MLLKPGCESSLLLHPPTQAQAEARNSERNCTLGNERERSDKASETIARDGAPALVEVSRGVNSSSSGEMPKRKANWWPPSILSDPDVLSVDDEGRFVLCKICHVHYAVHGGKRPKPVIMNSNFRTRAWENNSGVVNSAGKRPATTIPDGAPVPTRRRVFRAGSLGSSMQLLAESEAARRQNLHAYERHSLMAAGTGNHARRTGPSEHTMAIEQADSSARWRHMHDDVSRALNRRRTQGPASYTSGELRAAKTLAQTETGDLGSNNSERVAKKLQSLNAEYQASTMRHGDAYNMRHTNVFDQRSAGYKEYWGTLRDVYTSSGAASGGAAIVASYRKPHHRNSALVKPARKESKETEADSTTPGDSGSSEEAFKPAVVVHDASLINAIERLTDATSEQIANLYHRQSLDTREALAGLTSVMTDLRVQHGDAFDRIIELQEKHLKVMEDILEVKLRKEAARNARSCSSNESSSEGSSGSSPGSSTNEADSTTN
ncbi:hypothetical protein PF006_g18151 [Phytophthora fragariae]|uniref:Uncharacterized protein n=1 Tax=Phytophthora fragariae TaxID=53985 RepID=A0A6A3SN24_9STRA|nr:hypothetical protein PF006_g18151 [Phytophthora fragariae]